MPKKNKLDRALEKTLTFLEKFGQKLGRNKNFKEMVLCKEDWSDGHAYLKLSREVKTGKVILVFEGHEDLGYSPPVAITRPVKSKRDLPERGVWEGHLVTAAIKLGMPI